jgi:CRP-like cAMP-binding protein
VIVLTREEMGSMTAMTRETVTRILSRMGRDHIIRIHGAALTVLQPDALERLAI